MEITQDFELNLDNNNNNNNSIISPPYVFIIYYKKETKNYYLRAYRDKLNPTLNCILIRLSNNYEMPLNKKEMIAIGDYYFHINPLSDYRLEIQNLGSNTQNMNESFNNNPVQKYVFEINEYKIQFENIKTKFNPNLENEYFKMKSDYDNKSFLLNKINETLNTTYEKYYQKNISWYENEKIETQSKELEKINFLVSLINKFFNDNKYLIDLVSSIEKEKQSFENERNLPLVMNSISKNDMLQEILNEAGNIKNDSEEFHKNFENLIDYINRNLEII